LTDFLHGKAAGVVAAIRAAVEMQLLKSRLAAPAYGIFLNTLLFLAIEAGGFTASQRLVPVQRRPGASEHGSSQENLRLQPPKIEE
jgi:hypothetical protein